jgi:hypothetical protein
MDLTPKPPTERRTSTRKRTSGIGDQSGSISSAYHARMMYVHDIEDDLQRKGISTPPPKPKKEASQQPSQGQMPPPIAPTGSFRARPSAAQHSQSATHPRPLQQQHSNLTDAANSHHQPARAEKSEPRRADEVPATLCRPCSRLIARDVA